MQAKELKHCIAKVIQEQGETAHYQNLQSSQVYPVYSKFNSKIIISLVQDYFNSDEYLTALRRHAMI